jgi:sporulation protein YlmC with PRC-barrel domain
MSYAERDTFGMYKNHYDQTGGPAMMGANTLIGDKVHNLQQEHLGDIKEIMLDMRTNKIAFAVLSFGGLFTIGEKLLAVPWDALKLDSENKCFTLNMRKERFEDAPRFDPGNWPNMADLAWAERIHRYYNTTSL